MGTIFWRQQRAAYDERHLERVRALAMALDRELEGHARALHVLGLSSALQSGDVQSYEKTIREGIARLKAAHMDIILMDPQYAPRILGRPIHKAIVDTIGEVSNDLKVALFRRFAVMRYWVTSGQYRMEDIITQDQLHMNDASYHCIARLLADSLASTALATPLPQADNPMTIGSDSHAGMLHPPH